MSIKEKLKVKFTRILPFVIIAMIGVATCETLHSFYFSNSIPLYNAKGEYMMTYYDTPVSNFLAYLFNYLCMAFLLVLSFQLKFCKYHQIPIYFITANFVIMQLVDRYVFDETFSMNIYFFTLFLCISAIILSTYLYKHKNPSKR